MAWIALGVPIPALDDEFTADALASQARTALVAMVATGLWILGPHAWAKRRLIPRTALGAQLGASLVTVFVVIHGAAYPLLDPARSMGDGARRLAALVPPGEKMIAIHADETTRAIVPFYAGRLLDNRDGAWCAEEIEREFDLGTTRHVVVMDKDVEKLRRRKVRDKITGAVRFTPDLLGRLDLVGTVRVSATRVVHVYALEP
jgi:hypothetical protein